MTSKVELFNEMIKCHKQMLDILENDRQTTIAMESSQIVNSQSNQEQVETLQTAQKPQSNKVFKQNNKCSFKHLYASLVLYSWILYYTYSFLKPRLNQE